MILIVLGCLGFVFLTFFYLNKVIPLHNYFNLCFALSFLLFVVPTVLILLVSPISFRFSISWQLISALLAVISVALLTYSWFFTFPFTENYLALSKRSAPANTGMCAMCSIKTAPFNP